MREETVQVVGPDGRSSEGAQTPGLRREQAFADQTTWVGLVRAEPGQTATTGTRSTAAGRRKRAGEGGARPGCGP